LYPSEISKMPYTPSETSYVPRDIISGVVVLVVVVVVYWIIAHTTSINII
jgi:hypothetical protein